MILFTFSYRELFDCGGYINQRGGDQKPVGYLYLVGETTARLREEGTRIFVGLAVLPLSQNSRTPVFRTPVISFIFFGIFV
jgi:hypothetical protein